MARVEVPIVVINSDTGLPVNGAAVAITKRSNGSAATWYAAETGGSGSMAPVVTDANGRVAAWIDRGAYNAQISGTGITTYTEPFDLLPAGDLAGEGVWLPDNAILNRHLAADIVTGAEVADGAISSEHAATALKNLFPQWQTAANRRLAFGNALIDGAGFDSANVGTRTIGHGLGAAPVWVGLTSTTGVSSSDSLDPIVVSIVGFDATNIAVRVRTSSGGGISFPGIVIYWLAIY